MVLMLLFTPGVFANNLQQEIEIGINPNSPFYFIERIKENLDIAFTFNQDEKAVKHLKFAEKRLKEIKTLENTDRIESFQNNFEKNIEKSESLTISYDFNEKIEEIRQKNKRVLEEIKETLPEEAQKGIDRAIKNSQNVKTYSNEEKKQNVIDNQNRMMNDFLEEFEGKTFEIEVKNIQNNDIEFYYYKIQNKEFLESSTKITRPDYKIRINNKQEALELAKKYQNGEVISYNDVDHVFDVPLRLKGKLVSIVGIGGLN